MKKRLELFVYLSRVSRALDCPRARRRALMEKVRRDAELLLTERPEAETAASLGDPKELARGLLETLDQRELEQYRRRRTLLRRGVIALLAVTLIGIGTWAYYMWTHPKEIIVLEESTTLIIYPTRDHP